MEKETAYSNLAGSGDELLLMASMGVQEDFIQRVSSAVCESMRNEHVKDYDTICSRHDTIPTNFLKNCQYGGQSSFPLGGVVPILMKISKVKIIVDILLVKERDTMVLLLKINCTICHTMIIIMVHLMVTNKMGFTTMANINIILHHGEVGGDIML